MVLGARLRTVMSSIIRWRKAEILPAGGTEYAEGLLLLMRATVMENPVERHVGDSGNQVGVTTRRSWQPNATRRVSTLRNNGMTLLNAGIRRGGKAAGGEWNLPVLICQLPRTSFPGRKFFTPS